MRGCTRSTRSLAATHAVVARLCSHLHQARDSENRSARKPPAARKLGESPPRVPVWCITRDPRLRTLRVGSARLAAKPCASLRRRGLVLEHEGLRRCAKNRTARAPPQPQTVPRARSHPVCVPPASPPLIPPCVACAAESSRQNHCGGVIYSLGKTWHAACPSSHAGDFALRGRDVSLPARVGGAGSDA